MTYLPLSVLITTFKKENVKRPLEGFGVLVPSKEQQNGFKTLGNAFISPWLKKTKIGQTIPKITSEFWLILHNRYTFFFYDVSRSSTQWYASLYHLHRGNTKQGTCSSFNVTYLYCYYTLIHIPCKTLYVSIAIPCLSIVTHPTNFYLRNQTNSLYKLYRSWLNRNGNGYNGVTIDSCWLIILFSFLDFIFVTNFLIYLLQWRAYENCHFWPEKAVGSGGGAHIRQVCHQFIFNIFSTIFLIRHYNCSHFFWSKGFPLYGHNYGSVLEAIDKMEKDLPGFFYAGKFIWQCFK